MASKNNSKQQILIGRETANAWTYSSTFSPSICCCNWPVSLWYSTLQPVNLGMKTLNICSAHSPLERDKIVTQFNSKEDEHMIVLTSTRTTSASVNLQKCCSTVVFVEIPRAGNVLPQAWGRMNGRHGINCDSTDW